MTQPTPDPEVLSRQWRRVSITMWCIAVGVTAVMGAVFVRVAQLQIAPGERLAEHIQDRKSSRAQMAPRGDIVDRRGRVLSATRTGYRLFVDPSVLTAPYGELFSRLAEIAEMDENEIAQRIIPKISENQHRKETGETPIQYVSIGGVLPDWRLEAARKLKAPGVHLEMRSVREITGGDGVASLVGKVGVDHEGLIGAERAFNALVQPRPGRLDYVRDASGRAMWVEAAGYRPAAAGQSVWLSIDLAIQEIAEEEIERGVMEADAAGGRIIIADPMTGEILAMHDFVREMSGLVNPPARRPRGSPKQALPEVAPGTRFRTIRPDPRRAIHPALGRNRCVEDVYEPGSTFKPFMWASVTERGYAKPDEVFNTHNGVWVNAYGRTLRDVIPKDALTWANVLVYSSNIGMTQGVDRMPFGQTRADILRFGFGSRTDIGLPGESSGLVTSERNWTKYTQTSVASGYEVAVTPLQMVRAFSVFCRSGELAGTLPNLSLRAVTRQELASMQPRRVIPAWLAHQVRGIMLKVGEIMDTRMREIHKDEAPLLYSVFGKSGTAEIPRPDGRGYFKNQHNSSFIAGAPMETPRIVVLVVIDDPGPALVARRQHFGSWVAGPVVRRVVQRTLEYLGVPPTEPVAALASAQEAAASAGDHN